MKRLHLIEIEDQSWCPRPVRDAVTDYLQFAIVAAKPYAPIVPMLAAALERTGTRRVIDLCSGAGGPWLWLQPALAERGLSVSVALTDLYPNTQAFAWSCRSADQAICHHPQPVDATRVPAQLTGFRTIFTAFHHFRPEQARAVLADAVRARQGIGVFEATERRLLGLVLTLLAPVVLLGVTPLIRPFRWSRLFLTYLVPLAPFVTLFDGLVSSLRTYSVEELRRMTASMGGSLYSWEIGTVRTKGTPIPITYLIGTPVGTHEGAAPREHH